MARKLPSALGTEVSSLLPFAAIRLVVADLDGTLMTAGELWSSIGDRVRQVAHHRYGVRFTLATGRTYTGAMPLLRALELSNRVPVVLYNGGAVAEPRSGRLLMKTPIGAAVLQEVLEATADSPVNVLAYYWTTEDERFFDPQGQLELGEVVFGWSQTSHAPRVEFNGQPVAWQRSRAGPRLAGPCAVLVDTERCPEITDDLSARLNQLPGLAVTRSGHQFLEIRAKTSNKWTSLTWVVEQLGISTHEVLAIGDSENDIEMLVGAGIGVAVGNASAKVAALADYRSSYDSGSGALEVLSLVREARRLKPGLAPFASSESRPSSSPRRA